MEYRLQSMYNHMVGRTASVVSPFYSLLPDRNINISVQGPFNRRGVQWIHSSHLAHKAIKRLYSIGALIQDPVIVCVLHIIRSGFKNGRIDRNTQQQMLQLLLVPCIGRLWTSQWPTCSTIPPSSQSMQHEPQTCRLYWPLGGTSRRSKGQWRHPGRQHSQLLQVEQEGVSHFPSAQHLSDLPALQYSSH